MKIEVFVVDDIHEICTGSTCFEAERRIRDAIHYNNPIQGIAIIDGIAVKFNFSCLGFNGDIYTDNPIHILIVKHVVPLYVYNEGEQCKMAA